MASNKSALTRHVNIVTRDAVETPVEETTPLAADLSPVMSALEAAYRMIQKRFPDAPDVTIVIKRDSRAWGHTTVAQVWGDKTADSAHLYEIMISGENLRRGAVDVVATLIHEAAHARDLAAGIRGTDVNGRHNLRFKERAESMGLTVENVGWHGWTGTTLDEAGQKTWRAVIARVERGLERAVVAAAPPAIVVPPTSTPGGGISIGGRGISIAPPKRGGRRNLLLAKCQCDEPNSIRLSQRVLDIARPTCQECDGLFVAVD